MIISGSVEENVNTKDGLKWGDLEEGIYSILDEGYSSYEEYRLIVFSSTTTDARFVYDQDCEHLDVAKPSEWNKHRYRMVADKITVTFDNSKGL